MSIEVAVTQSSNEDVGLAGIGAPPATDRHNATSEVLIARKRPFVGTAVHPLYSFQPFHSRFTGCGHDYT